MHPTRGHAVDPVPVPHRPRRQLGEVNWATDTSNDGRAPRGARSTHGGACTPTNVGGRGTHRASRWAPLPSTSGRPRSPCPARAATATACSWARSTCSAAMPRPSFTTQVPAGSTDAVLVRRVRRLGPDRLRRATTPTPPGCWARSPRSGRGFAVTVGDNGYPSGSQTNNGDLQQHGADTSAIFGPAFWTAGRAQPADVHRARQPRDPVRRRDPQHRADQLAPGRRRVDVGRPVRARDVLLRERHHLRVVPERVVRVRRRQRPLLRAAAPTGPTATWAPAPSTATTTPPTGRRAPRSTSGSRPTSPPTRRGLKFAFFHYPLYSDQKAQNSDTYLQGAASLEGLLASNHVSHRASTATPTSTNATLPTGPGTFPSYVTGGGGGTLAARWRARVPRLRRVRHRLVTDASAGQQLRRAPGPDVGRPRVPLPPRHASRAPRVTVTPTDEYGRTFDVQTYDFSANVPPDTVHRQRARRSLERRPTATFAFHASASRRHFLVCSSTAPARALHEPR